MSDTRSRRLLTRRTWLLGTAAVALGACDSSRPRQGFLGARERFNQRVQAALLDPERLAPEEPVEALTRPGAFPQYFTSDRVPRAPAGWALQVGGRVARPGLLSLDELRLMPRTDYRIRHHCVEGWSAVADGEVPHRGELPPSAHGRLLGGPRLRVVRRSVTQAQMAFLPVPKGFTPEARSVSSALRASSRDL